jgi:hypothetical protein
MLRGLAVAARLEALQRMQSQRRRSHA